MLKDGGLAAEDAAGFVEVAFLGIIEERQAVEGRAVELEIAGVTLASRDPATDAVAHTVVAGDQTWQPAKPTRPAER